MRRVCLALIAAALILLLLPPAGAVALTLNAAPAHPHVGDVVTLHGQVTGTNTIAVYLFLSGPGLDPRGVTLENLNIPAGRGLFTTAPVNMSDGTWTYVWDTSVILGNLEPGTYTVYEVSSPVDRLRYSHGDYATTDVTFLPGGTTVTQTPLDPAIAVAAMTVAGILCMGILSGRKKR